MDRIFSNTGSPPLETCKIVEVKNKIISLRTMIRRLLQPRIIWQGRTVLKILRKPYPSQQLAKARAATPTPRRTAVEPASGTLVAVAQVQLLAGFHSQGASTNLQK